MDILLTEKEVAERLRCAVSKVRRLRRTGKLAFLPGRPVLIREEDLRSYIEGALKLNPPIDKAPASKHATPQAAREKAYDPVEAARRAWILRQLRTRGDG